MCIVLITSAHPAYALVILDNRDEFILRPTSRPHWWSTQHQDILSARDLQRAEQGTWLGVTKTGNFAVLTNFRETDTHDAKHPVQGERSRGGMVTAWLTGAKEETTTEFVHRLLDGEGVTGVGGFSLICGKLRKGTGKGEQDMEPLAIISNRCEDSCDVPWIAGSRNEVYGLSNTSYNDPIPWPKVVRGKKLLLSAVNEAISHGWDEETLVEKLYSVLDTETLPAQNGRSFEECISELKNSIFIPPIVAQEKVKAAPRADEIAAAGEPDSQHTPNCHSYEKESAEDALKQEERPDPETNSGMTGPYGTQRQTIILVDWEGNLTFRERSLWDADGNPIPHGQGDMRFEYKIDGWEGWETKANGNGVHVHSELQV